MIGKTAQNSSNHWKKGEKGSRYAFSEAWKVKGNGKTMTEDRQIEKTDSAEETQAVARALAPTLRPGCVLAFHGPLGAGTTWFIQGLAMGLGITQAVSSPTYTIINEYKCQPPLYHIDLYRIHSEDEALALGLDEYLYGEGITAIEWSERIAELLPPATIHVDMGMSGPSDTRIITITRGQ